MSQESLWEDAIDERALQRAHLHTRRDMNRDDADSQEKSTNKKVKQHNKKENVRSQRKEATPFISRSCTLSYFCWWRGESWINKQGVLQAPSWLIQAALQQLIHDYFVIIMKSVNIYFIISIQGFIPK